MLVVLWGCGGTGTLSGGSASPSLRNYLGTEGPGDVWSWQLTGTTFTATNQTQGLHYSGTESVLSTGFLKLTVSSTDDPNVAAGQSAYALELPGTALVLKPAGADTKPPIVAASLGGNPAGPVVSFNFVEVPSATFNPATDQAFGHVTFNVSGNTYTGTSKRFAINGTALADGPSTFVGNGGMMTDTGNNPATGAMTPSGVCVLDYGPSNGGVIGVIQPAANVDLADLGTRSFRGFLINQGKTQCVAVTPNGDGTLHGQGYANPTGVETGTSDNGSGVTVTFTGQPNPGEVTVSITTTGGVENLVAAINRVNGKYMLFCFGVPQSGNGQPYNVVLVEN
ncbi:MAG TPA: hypothetical protein VKT78_11250 [Fimbriimonadaceae bacterium]|nr:hypothetical protein [Fimbriimonadaceae bacterium]